MFRGPVLSADSAGAGCAARTEDGSMQGYMRFGGSVAIVLAALAAHGQLTVNPKVALTNPAALDQDDMCIWLHPEDPALSMVIASDKKANMLFVYSMTGETLQSISVEGKPGNIDLRYGFPLDGKEVDIAAFNERDRSAIHVYIIDLRTRLLSRADDKSIATGPNYGFCLYRSRRSGKFYAFVVSDEHGQGVEQYELHATESGQIGGERVRSWKLGKSEGCVADDETGALYVGEEERGIWKFGAEPSDPDDGTLIAEVGTHGLEADVEGLTLWRGTEGQGYLIASSQGNGQFKVFERKPPHAYVKTFTVAGAGDTDGIDLLNADLGPKFPNGVFALHNGNENPCPVLLCDLRALGLEPAGFLLNPREWRRAVPNADNQLDRPR